MAADPAINLADHALAADVVGRMVKQLRDGFQSRLHQLNVKGFEAALPPAPDVRRVDSQSAPSGQRCSPSHDHLGMIKPWGTSSADLW